MSMTVDSETLVMTCCQVVGAGKFCGAACALGRVKCKEHEDRAVDARAASQALEAARQRVLIRLEERADDLAQELITIALDSETPAAVRVAAIAQGFKVLGLDKIDINLNATISETTPDRLERDRRLLNLLEKAGAPDRAIAIRKALAIEVKAK